MELGLGCVAVLAENRTPLPKPLLPARLCLAVGNSGGGLGQQGCSPCTLGSLEMGQRVVYSELLSQKIPLDTLLMKLLPEIHRIDGVWGFEM